MGCFLGCFGGRKNRRREKRRESYQATENKHSVKSAKPDHLNDRVTTAEEIPKASLIPITEICDEVEVKRSPSPTRKRVTFDSEVKTYEHIVFQESVELLEKKEEEEKELNSSKTGQSSSENFEIASNSSGSYPSNHRYKNCRESDDEIEEDELDCGESDLDEDEEYYSDDGFSEDKLLKPTEEAYTEEIRAKTEETDTKLKRSNESVRDENHYVQGVLNPVENLTQWKSAKSKGRTIQKQSQKENSNFISDQEDERDSSSFGTNPQIDDITQSFKPKSRIEPKKLRSQERAVDASLSTWLSTSETSSEYNSASMYISTPEKHKSSCYSKPVKNSHDDRPILCALTLEDIKQFSATSTPRKSPTKSPDETPIIGTVGGYWSNHSMAIDCGSASSFKGIPNTSSKYREVHINQ